MTRCENLPELFTEKGKAPRKRARPLKGLKDEAHLAALAESCPLRLTARLDGDGDPMTRRPGDLMGAASEPIAPGARGVQIVFDERL